LSLGGPSVIIWGMSGLTTKEVLRLAALANLTLTDGEIESLRLELFDVINYFEGLKKLRTDNVLPTSQTTGLNDILRQDKIDATRILSLEEALSGTEKVHNGAFVVQQVIDKDK